MAIIDLRSDTVTKPDAAMRDVIACAEVGDDVHGEDPTVNRLQDLAAERLGKEAGLFVPSGTMGNQICLRTHTRPGDAAIAGQNAHMYLYESAAAAAISGVQFTLVGEGGLFTAEDVRAAIYPSDDHFARTSIVCLENTHNAGGGRVFPESEIRAIAQMARDHGLAMHLDGARLFNAEVASGISAADQARHFESISFCLSKGLGAPVGSLVVGSRDFIREAHRARKLLGGGMRQAGLLAAAGIYALENNVKRLERDHANAKRLADGFRGIDTLEVVGEPETNMVFLRSADPTGFSERARERGLRINPMGPDLLRAVTHLDVADADIDRTLEIAREVAG